MVSECVSSKDEHIPLSGILRQLGSRNGLGVGTASRARRRPLGRHTAPRLTAPTPRWRSGPCWVCYRGWVWMTPRGGLWPQDREQNNAWHPRALVDYPSSSL